MGFPRYKYWNGLPFPSLWGFPDPGIELLSPALQVDSLPLSYQESFYSLKVKVAHVCSCPLTHVRLFTTTGLYSPWNSPGQNTGVGSHSLLQGIFSTQGLNPGLLYCRQILYQLSHKGSPRILEWKAHPFSTESSWPRNRTRVSCIAGRFFTNWAIREAH